LVGVLLLVGLVSGSVSKELFARIFTGKSFLDPFIGSVLGGVAAGNPLTSYIIGGELLKKGVSMVAVVAFILTWVTVGVIQIPAESMMLGKQFALIRNGVSFVMAIIISLLTVFTMELI
jgi:uncharacterized membrane protein YraQ (UPF0718 family)